MTLWCGEGGVFKGSSKGSSKGSFKGSFKGFFKGSFLGFSGSDVKVNPISNPILIRFHLNHFDSVVYFLLNDSSGIWFRLRRSSPPLRILTRSFQNASGCFQRLQSIDPFRSHPQQEPSGNRFRSSTPEVFLAFPPSSPPSIHTFIHPSNNHSSFIR